MPIEVAKFLKADDRRLASPSRQARMYLSYQPLDEALKYKAYCCSDILNDIIKKDTLKKLRVCVSKLNNDEKKLVYLKYEKLQTREAIGCHFGTSKMDMTKGLMRLQAKLRNSMQVIA